MPAHGDTEQRARIAARALRTLLPLVAAGFLLSPLHADWVNLVQGGRVDGTIVRQTERELTIYTNDGAMITIQMRQVSDFFCFERKVTEKEKQAEKQQEEEEEKGVVYHRAGITESGVEQRIGDLWLRLPEGFATDPQRGIPPAGGEILRSFINRRTLARIQITRRPLPAGVTSLDGLAEEIRANVTTSSGATQLVRVERTRVAARPCVEWVVNAPARMLTSAASECAAWIEIQSGLYYEIRLRVPEGHADTVDKLFSEFLNTIRPVAALAAAPATQPEPAPAPARIENRPAESPAPPPEATRSE